MGNITYIRDDWFPGNLTDAKDMTAGGLSSFGGGITKVFSSNEIKFRTQFDYSNDYESQKTTWWENASNYAASTKHIGNADSICKTSGLTIQVEVNGLMNKNINSLTEIGLGCRKDKDATNFASNSTTIGVRDVMGFSMVWKTESQHQYNIGTCYPEKIGMIYAAEQKSGLCNKIIIPAKNKLVGDTLKSYQIVESTSPEYYSVYSIGDYNSTAWKQVKDRKLMWLGIIIQTKNPNPVYTTETQKLIISHFRPIVCGGSSWGDASALMRSQICNGYYTKTLSDARAGKIGLYRG